MSGNKDQPTHSGSSQRKLLNDASRMYLKTERRLLIGLVFAGWSLFLVGLLFQWFGYIEYLGPEPPRAAIHEQTATEQYRQIVNSKLGQTGGMPLQRQKSTGIDNEEQPESEKTALVYLSSLRNLNA